MTPKPKNKKPKILKEALKIQFEAKLEKAKNKNLNETYRL